MRTGSTKKYNSSARVVDNGNLQKKLLDIMLGLIGFLALCYFIFLATMVWNIVERKSLESYASNLSNEVGNLELEYLTLSEKVDLDFAYSLGFKETKAKYATRKTLGSIEIVNNEI